MKQLLLISLMMLLAACSVPEASTPAPTPEAIYVIYPAALKPWADKIADCASNNPLIALYFTQSPTSDTNIDSNEVVLKMGDQSPINAASTASQVGWEQIVIIVNQDNKSSQLSSSELQSIFSGQISSWDNNSGQHIQVWVFSNGDPVREYFDRSVLHSNILSPDARLAPDPQAMLEAISTDANAIGYLPSSTLSKSDPNLVAKLKNIQLDSSLQEELHQPVIAITQNEPEGLLRELLVCAQTIAH